MATIKTFVFVTELIIFCLEANNIDTAAGSSSPEHCSNIDWHESFWDKVYYVLRSETDSYKYSDVAKNCSALGIDKLVIDSLAENDFIVQTMERYHPTIESKVFLACPSDAGVQTPNRRFRCRMSSSFYDEGSHSFQGFWNWRDGKPQSENGGCLLLSSLDGSWSVSDCGQRANFLVCQCRRGIPPGTFASTRFYERSFGSRNCLNSDLIMRVVPVYNFVACAMECQSDGNCASFNFKDQERDTIQVTCHLSAYHSSVLQEISFIREENCRYFERMLS